MYNEVHFSSRVNQIFCHISSSLRGMSPKFYLLTFKLNVIFLGENQLLPHIASSLRDISSKRSVFTVCIVKGIFIGEEISFSAIWGFYKGHISDTFLCYPEYPEGHFSWRGNRLLLHISSAVRGIPQKRLVVTLCKLKGIFLGEQIIFCYISELL